MNERWRTIPGQLWLPVAAVAAVLEGLIVVVLATSPAGSSDPVGLGFLLVTCALAVVAAMVGLVRQPLVTQSLVTLVMVVTAGGSLPAVVVLGLEANPATLSFLLAAAFSAVGSLAWLSVREWSSSARRWLGLGDGSRLVIPWWPVGTTSVLMLVAFLLDGANLLALLALSGLIVVVGVVPMMRGLVTGQFLTLSSRPTVSLWDRRQYYRDTLAALPASGLFIVVAYGYTIIFGAFSAPTTDEISLLTHSFSVVVISPLYIGAVGFWALFQLYHVEQELDPSFDALQGTWSAAFSFLATQAAVLTFQTFVLSLVFFPAGSSGLGILVQSIELVRQVTFQIFEHPQWLGLVQVLVVSFAAAAFRPRFFSPQRFWQTWSVTLALTATVFALFDYILTSGPIDANTTVTAWSASRVYCLTHLTEGAVLGALLQALHLAVNRHVPVKPLPLPVHPAPLWGNAIAFVIFLALQLTSYFLEGGSAGAVVFPFLLIGGYTVFSSWRRRGFELTLAEKTRLLDEKIAENETLLLNILPEAIATRLKAGEGTIADAFPSVSVLFADIVGFTVMSKAMTSAEVVGMLDELFRAIDTEARALGVEKIKTIGDCYMAVAGIPDPVDNHADRAVALGLAILKCVREFNARTGKNLSIRIGINSGNVVAGVIGHHKYIYDLWGDAVNTASRMESHGTAGAIMLTDDTKTALKRAVALRDNGVKDIKGKGPMQTWVVEDRA